MIAYSVAFAGGGWHPTDHEYVPALAWRLFHGEVPYRDFIYHKTPGTLLLHWVWFLLPDSIEVRASRVFVYLQMAAATAVPTVWAVRRGVVEFGWRVALLGVATTAIALHNFPIMPWQTTDGVFFSSLGWVCLGESTLPSCRRPLLWRGLGSAALAFALLCKQSFVLSCVAFAAVVAGELAWALVRGQKEARGAAVARALGSAVPAGAVVGATVAWLWLAGAWPQFLARLGAYSKGATLWFYVASPYRNRASLWAFALGSLVPFLRALDGPGGGRWVARMMGMVPLAVLAWSTHRLAGAALWQLGPRLAAAMAGLLAGEALLWLMSRRAARAPATSSATVLLLGAGGLLIALGCQVSLGYTSPILGLGLLGLLLHAVLPRERSWLDVAAAAAAAVVICRSMWQINVQAPYRDAPRPALTQDLGDLFPRLAGIKTHPANHERYAALRRIVRKGILPTGRPFVALQDYPGVNWLFGTRNPVALDWDAWPEPVGSEQRVIDQLVSQDVVAIVPKEADASWGAAVAPPEAPCGRLGFEKHAQLSRFVARNWSLIGENDYFCLFRRPS